MAKNTKHNKQNKKVENKTYLCTKGILVIDASDRLQPDCLWPKGWMSPDCPHHFIKHTRFNFSKNIFFYCDKCVTDFVRDK